MNNIPTPHNTAKIDDFAKTVIMPGDPLRAKFIAEKYLNDAAIVNNVRGINGYTGYYKNKKVSVMASGMGMPSMGIYSYELFNYYNVDNIIRVGSAGAISDKLKIKDIVIAQSASTNSNYANQYRLPGTYAPTADYELIEKAVKIARDMNIEPHVGNIFSSDTFYDDAESLKEWTKMGVLAVEMESAALYMNAARAKKKALCICTISDCPFTGESASAEDRQNTFTQMMEIALELA